MTNPFDDIFFRERARAKARAEMETSPPRWWWLSFADPARPAGSQWLGCAIVRAQGFGHATLESHRLGVNPGGEIHGTEIPDDMNEPTLELRERLITDKDELDRLTTAWTGQGIRRIDEDEDEDEDDEEDDEEEPV